MKIFDGADFDSGQKTTDYWHHFIRHQTRRKPQHGSMSMRNNTILVLFRGDFHANDTARCCLHESL